MAVTQSHYRFGIDEGTESTHGWYAAEDANPGLNAISFGKTFLLRFTLQCDGTLQSNVDPEFQYRLNGGTWTQITTSSAVVKAVTPTCWADAANTTQRLSGTGTFEASSAGCTVDGIAGGAAMDIVANGNAETECALQLVGNDLRPGDLIEFRLTRDGAVLIDTYAVTPAIRLREAVTFDFRRTVKGPFPFPKEKPSFVAQTDFFSALSGIAATAAIGILGATISIGLSGVGATASIGSVTPSHTITASGLSATGSLGTLSSPADQALTGVASTGSVGNVGFSISFIDRPRLVTGPFPFPKERPAHPISLPPFNGELTGVASTGQLGAVTANSDVPASGVGATGSLGTVTASDENSASLSGISSTGEVGTTTITSTVGLSGVSSSTSQGSLAIGAVLSYDRPRFVQGPFPFPKERPAHPISVPTGTVIGLAATGVVGAQTSSITVPVSETSGGSSQPGQLITLGIGPASSVSQFILVGLGIPPDAGTGVQGIGQTGISGAAFAPALTQVSASGAVGSVTFGGVSVGLTGVQATGLRGTLQTGTPGSAELTGVSGTASPGTATPTITLGLTGLQATGSVGTVRPTRLIVDRPHSLTGPFPFLTGGFFQFRQKPRVAVPVSQPFTVQLTGVAGSGAVGTLSTSQSVTPTGKVGTGVVSAPVPTFQFAATGISAIGFNDVLTPNNSRALVGSSASGATGTLASTTAVAPTGNAATGAVGTFGFAQALTSVTGTGTLGTVAPDTNVTLSGIEANSALGSPAAQVNDNVTVGLSSVSATGSVEPLSVSNEQFLDSQFVSGAVGTLTADAVRQLTAVSTTGQISAPSAEAASALTGQVATGVTGDIGFGTVLLGIQAQAQVGTFTPTADVTLSSASATGLISALAAQANEDVSINLNGLSATGSVNTPAASAIVDSIGVTATGIPGTLGFSQGIFGGVATSVQGGSVSSVVSVGLSGIGATTSIKSLIAQADQNVSIGLDGFTASGQVGAVAVSSTVAHSGVTSSGQVDSLAAADVVDLTASTSTASLGTLTAVVDVTVQLSGFEVTASITSLISDTGPILEGQVAIGEVSAPIPEHIVLPVGLEAVGRLGTLAVDEAVVVELIGRFDNVIELRGTDG